MKKKVIIGIFAIVSIGCGSFFFFNKEYTVYLGNEIYLVKNLSKLEDIDVPEKEGYTFAGWYNGNKKFDLNQRITSNIKLEARYEIKKFVVTFNTNNDISIENQSIEYGNIIIKPSDPTKDGAKFIGWYLDDQEYDFNTKVTSDLVLNARWEQYFTIKFDSDGGSTINSQTIIESNTANKPSNPSKSGYEFVEWQLNDKTYDFNTKITANITLKAKWKKVEKLTAKMVCNALKEYSKSHTVYDNTDMNNCKIVKQNGNYYLAYVAGYDAALDTYTDNAGRIVVQYSESTVKIVLFDQSSGYIGETPWSKYGL